jgi:hypothetical protein
MDDIVENISPTADIVSIVRPVYNFKANSTTIKEKNKADKTTEDDVDSDD